MGTSLMAQWLGLCVCTDAQVQSWLGTRSRKLRLRVHMLQYKVTSATLKADIAKSIHTEKMLPKPQSMMVENSG